jgi:hypothetical protein
MLHLLPIRWLLRFAFGIVGLAVLSAVYAGWIGTGEPTRDALLLLRWSSILALGAIVLVFAAWRWVPPIQRFIFPYLGGRWSGSIRFEEKGGFQERDITLEIKHTLFGMRLLLDSEQSTSWTLAVHAERDEHFERYRLFYVYLNERKFGFPGGGQHYRGLAVIRIELGDQPRLEGNYFTDTDREGTLHLKLEALHPWWKLWR